MVVEGRLVCLGELLTVLLDVRRRFDLLLGHRHLQFIGTDPDPAQRHEGQVTPDEPLLDGGELWLVVLNVDVDVLQLADLLTIAIDQHLAVPFGDVPLGTRLLLGHPRSLLVCCRGADGQPSLETQAGHLPIYIRTGAHPWITPPFSVLVPPDGTLWIAVIR